MLFKFVLCFAKERTRQVKYVKTYFSNLKEGTNRRQRNTNLRPQHKAGCFPFQICSDSIRRGGRDLLNVFIIQMTGFYCIMSDL